MPKQAPRWAPTTSSTSSASGTTASTSTSTSTPNNEQPDGVKTPGGAAGAAVGATVGGILFLLIIISVLMWYCRRKRNKADVAKPGHLDFKPAVDSVAALPPSTAKDSARRSAQILAMDDPAAWRQAYTSANPQQLDSRSVHLDEKADMADGVGSPREVVQRVSGRAVDEWWLTQDDDLASAAPILRGVLADEEFAGWRGAGGGAGVQNLLRWRQVGGRIRLLLSFPVEAGLAWAYVIVAQGQAVQV